MSNFFSEKNTGIVSLACGLVSFSYLLLMMGNYGYIYNIAVRNLFLIMPVSSVVALVSGIFCFKKKPSKNIMLMASFGILFAVPGLFIFLSIFGFLGI